MTMKRWPRSHVATISRSWPMRWRRGGSSSRITNQKRGEHTMDDDNVWRHEYAVETSASAETIWSIFRDVPGWKSCNAGIEQIDIDGPFATGTWFTMKPPGEEALRSQLIEIRENARFIDETRVGDLVIKV